MTVYFEPDVVEGVDALAARFEALGQMTNADHACTPSRLPILPNATATTDITAITIVTYADRMFELPPSHMSSTSTANTSVPGAVRKIDAAYSRNARSATYNTDAVRLGAASRNTIR